CVIVDVMRVGPASGMATHPAQGDVMQSRWGTHGDHPIVVLSPSTVAEAYSLTIEAVNISEMLRVPVILLSDAVVGHLRERIELPDPLHISLIERKMTKQPPDQYKPYAAGEDGVPEFAEMGSGYRYHICSNVHNEFGFPTDSGHVEADILARRLQRKIDLHQDKITFYKTYDVEDAEILLVAYGCVARSAKDAVKIMRREGVKLGLLQLQTLWPFPAEIVRKLSEGVKAVIVPEMNLGQLINEVRACSRKNVVGVNKVDGTVISPREIIAKVKEVK
ncbi:MAG: 2-oxoacid:acceptor oxidoreductase subunit alpha, partial [Bacteroidales bacterium]|nr:2-oxoacid:acceptor oxidoreductase subunit alpha [Bacteroidales bacterium]